MAIDQEDKLRELQNKLAFVLRALACLAADEIEGSIKATNIEAYAGCSLGQELSEEMIKLAMKPGGERHR